MIVNTTTTMNQIDNNDALLQEHVNTIGKLTPERLQEMDTKINTIQEQSQYIMATANSLAQSIKTALGEMDRTQLKHEQVIQKNDSTVANLIQHSQVLWERNRVLEENQTRQQNELMQNVQQHQLTNQQTHALWNGQEMNRNQQNVADAQIQRMQSEMMRLREENRNRPMQNTTERGLQPSPQQAQKEKGTAEEQVIRRALNQMPEKDGGRETRTTGKRIRPLLLSTRHQRVNRGGIGKKVPQDRENQQEYDPSGITLEIEGIADPAR